ncbi:hypothetical protein OH807_13045 [Kitasatospora sp. NBC_01560]|uniref:hypothetical protein n=1 Tax=Kitasatospora sp. NBC_01560 TaxID=2975965 RepID=UPI003863F717
MDLLGLEPMSRRSGGAPAGRSRGRRAAALAGLVLAAAVTVAGCDGGGKTASDAATSQPSAGAASAPGSPGATTPPATAPVTPPPADPSASTPDPRPTGPVPSGPALTPTPAPTPPREGIAVGEPDPNGASAGSAVHPAITYRVDGNRLTVWFYGGICERYALKADESKPGRVDVRVAVAAPVPAGQSCAELAKRQTVTADLKQPLAGRAVTDLATGQPVPLEADPHVGPDPATPDVSGR